MKSIKFSAVKMLKAEKYAQKSLFLNKSVYLCKNYPHSSREGDLNYLTIQSLIFIYV